MIQHQPGPTIDLPLRVPPPKRRRKYETYGPCLLKPSIDELDRERRSASERGVPEKRDVIKIGKCGRKAISDEVSGSNSRMIWRDIIAQYGAVSDVEKCSCSC